MNQFVLADSQKCIACRTCEVACAIAHSTDDLSVTSFISRINVIKDNQISTAITCRHCENPPCAAVCPNNAIIYRHNSIQILQNKCIGCKSCITVCPYGAIRIVKHNVTKTENDIKISHKTFEIVKCDLCENIAESARCVEICPTNALILVNAESINAIIKEKQQVMAK